MVNGVHGDHIVHAPNLVTQEQKRGVESAIIRNHLMVENIALAQLHQNLLAILMDVQVSMFITLLFKHL